ncbi:MAG: twin transmembrane helix small protein [Sterolibacterium sp.]|nr:twin transmembrane helix small protein [Sterolibacterium sp.]
MKIIVIAFLLVILGSLASALFFLLSDKPGSQRTVRALTLRVGLSILLFVLLIAGYYFGFIGNPPLR